MVVDSYRMEILRKLIHLLALAYLGIYFLSAAYFGHRTGLEVLCGLLVLLLLLEFLPLGRWMRHFWLDFLNNFRREKELGRVGAEIYLILGVIISLAVYDTVIAVAAILMMVFGDLSAALVGRKYGRHRPSVFGGEKSLEGALACLLVNLLTGFIYFGGPAAILWQQDFALRTPGVTFSGPGFSCCWLVPIMSAAAALSELALDRIDDNLSIPLIAGFAGQLTMTVINLG